LAGVFRPKRRRIHLCATGKQPAEITLYEVLLTGELSPVFPWLKLTAVPECAVDISTQEAIEWDNTYTATQF